MILVVAVAVALAAGVAPSLAGARTVRYHGYRLQVPRSWPVFDLARAPRTCVRFNRNAVYLGAPSANQDCPAHAVGRTEAILVQPLAAVQAGTRGEVIRGTDSVSSFSIRSAGLSVTATWLRHRAALSKILGRPVSASPAPANGYRASGPRRPAARRVFRPLEATYSGLGFDACSAPSISAMSAWSASPYRAVGIYLGGVNSACSQPNLTAGWVSDEVAVGWHLIPTYVGLQGRGSCSNRCATINPARASLQGSAAAREAVAQAQSLGIPAGNPIYDDMEAYTPTAGNSAAVLSFLSGWTLQLHAEGYLSGVYSSDSSGIAALARQWGTGYAEPDDLWMADWNGAANTGDPYVPTYEWSDNQRLHQYRGAHNETYGGVRINIDNDYIGGATADTSGPIPDGTFVEVDGSPNVYVIAGGAPLYISDPLTFPGIQPIQMLTPQQFSQLPRYPANGTFLTTTTGQAYRVAGGAPILITNWALFGGPQPSVTVDEWDLENLGNPRVGLRATPFNGTVVKGLPSDTYWLFSDGARASVARNVAAVAVDDQGLTPFRETPASLLPHARLTGRCVVPRLTHLSLVKARAKLRRAHCRVGKVRRPRHRPPGHLLRVVSQSPRAHSVHRAGYKVRLRMM